MNPHLKQAYTLGAQQALADAGIKTAVSDEYGLVARKGEDMTARIIDGNLRSLGGHSGTMHMGGPGSEEAERDLLETVYQSHPFGGVDIDPLLKKYKVTPKDARGVFEDNPTRFGLLGALGGGALGTLGGGLLGGLLGGWARGGVRGVAGARGR